MNCRVVLQHSSKVYREKLSLRLQEVFGSPGLGADTWKKQSPRYRDLGDIEQKYIWGNREVDGLLYAFLFSDPRNTEVYLEHPGDYWTFPQFRRVIENGIEATRNCQRRWRKCKIDNSSFHENDNDKSLGVTVSIKPWYSIGGLFSPAQIPVVFLTFLLTIVYNFFTQSKPLQQFFTDLTSYQIPALFMFIVLVLLNSIVLAYQFCFKKSEVMFSVK